MADFFLSNLKSTLDNCITELDEIHSMFCRNPESDFTRNRKLFFREYIQFMLQMQSKSVSNEILDFFDHSLSAPSKSAFTQQRYKLLPAGWDFLFHSFVNQCRTLSDNLYNGYRLLACDGSDVNISHNPADERTFIHEGEKGYNAIHINALYDITSNGILSTYDLPDSEFDTHIRTTLTRRHTKETLGNPNTYTILQPSTDFDFLDEHCMYYDIEFRIVRIRLDNGTYICIATNLSEEFPLEEINKLYRMRWSEKTSFRELKYTIGLINWHSSKYDGILQEINARMILYNFCELATFHAVVKTSKNTKHVYKINFATAVNICRAYLKHGGDETETMLLIQKYLTPVRYNRKYPIHLRPKRNRDFMYRIA